jgi:hypothetical protein
MKLKCIRPILTEDGVAEIIYFFDTETLELEFKEEDRQLLLKIASGEAFDVPDMTKYILQEETKEN